MLSLPAVPRFNPSKTAAQGSKAVSTPKALYDPSDKALSLSRSGSMGVWYPMLFSEDPSKASEAAETLQLLASQGDLQCPMTIFDALVHVMCRSEDTACAAAAARALYCLEKQYHVVWQGREVWPVTGTSLLSLLSGTNSSSSSSFGGSSIASSTGGGSTVGTTPTPTTSCAGVNEEEGATIAAIVAAKAVAALATPGAPPEGAAWLSHHGKHIVLALVELAEYAPYGDLGCEAVLVGFDALALLADMGFSALDYFQTQALSNMLDLVHESDPQKAHVALMALTCLVSQPNFAVKREQQLMNPACRLHLSAALKKLQQDNSTNSTICRAVKRLQQKLMLAGSKPGSPLGRPSTPTASVPGRAPSSPVSVPRSFGLAQGSQPGNSIGASSGGGSSRLAPLDSTVHGGAYFGSCSSGGSCGIVPYGLTAAVVERTEAEAEGVALQPTGEVGQGQDGGRELKAVRRGGGSRARLSAVRLMQLLVLLLPLLFFIGHRPALVSSLLGYLQQ